jgi:hypothetical protein
MTITEGGMLLREAKRRRDPEMLQYIVGTKDVFPLIRRGALEQLDGKASRPFLEGIALDRGDPHDEIRVQVIRRLPVESMGVLEHIKRRRGESSRIKDAAVQRFNGLALLRRDHVEQPKRLALG